MTTGRINQVTILRVRSLSLSAPRLVTPHPRKGVIRIVTKEGDEPKDDAQPGRPPGPKPPEEPTDHPFAPTELPKENGPGQT